MKNVFFYFLVSDSCSITHCIFLILYHLTFTICETQCGNPCLKHHHNNSNVTGRGVLYIVLFILFQSGVPLRPCVYFVLFIYFYCIICMTAKRRLFCILNDGVAICLLFRGVDGKPHPHGNQQTRAEDGHLPN